MRIVDLLPEEHILLNAPVVDKDSAFRLLFALQETGGLIEDMDAYRAAVLAREAQASTAVEAGIAIPHARCACVKRPVLALCRAKEPVDCGALDGNPTDLFFMIAAPPDGKLHIEVLSSLMKLLSDRHFTRALRAAPDAQAVRTVIDRFEAEGDSDRCPVDGPPRILAVTACPTGIAHTYMAAQALERAGHEMGVSVKAETQGAAGVKNALTPAEIKACEGVIVAASREVDLSRFDGVRVLRVPVADGIRRPAELIREVARAPVYHPREDKAVRSILDGKRLPKRTYRQMMSGVSYMLPFVIGGGLLTALGLLLDDPLLGLSGFGANTPVAAWCTGVGDAALSMMLPVMAAFIAMAVADAPGFAPGFVGGMLAVTGSTFDSAHGVPAGFLGAIVAGFAAGYFMLGLKRALARLPSAFEGIKPVLLYPLIGITVTGLFMYLVNPVVGALNEALYSGLASMRQGSSIVLGAVLAGMMAGDMGGPFNKAAYVFGTSTLAALTAAEAAGSRVMASVMLGGMVPPLATALATTFFGRLFTAEERKAGGVNYVLGLCFITEGAIPFAARDPLRVLPACIAGSALSGALSMAFDCRLPAPHGGIFVLPVVHNPVWYLLALAAGSALGMVLLALFKRVGAPENK